ncbi:MAG: iron-containing alcohol dehydrogenase, partial [Chitinispirillaceae bacterium]
MDNFEFQNRTRIIFGKTTENQTGTEVRKYSDKVLLHYGGSSIKKFGLYDRITKSLKDAGVE